MLKFENDTHTIYLPNILVAGFSGSSSITSAMLGNWVGAIVYFVASLLNLYVGIRRKRPKKNEK